MYIVKGSETCDVEVLPRLYRR